MGRIYNYILILFLSASSFVYSQDDFSSCNLEILKYINLARTNPVYFAENYLSSRRSDSPEAEECFMEMINYFPKDELIWSDLLFNSAKDHSDDVGSNGLIGHLGSDSSTLRERIERYADWKGSIAENIYYGDSKPLEIVILFLIDEGIEDRGHRRNILNGNFQYTGVSVSSHFYYRKVCVVHFAEFVKEKKK